MSAGTITVTIGPTLVDTDPLNGDTDGEDPEALIAAEPVQIPILPLWDFL